MNEMVTQLNESLIIDVSDILGEYLELGVDEILDNELIKSIPIVKTFVGVGKIVKNVSDRNMMKNCLLFLNELNSGNIDKEKLYKYKEELNNNPRKAEKELGRVIIILDKIIDDEKTVLLGRIYKAYVNQVIDWDLFVEFSEMINRMYLQDLRVLKLLYTNKLKDSPNVNDNFRVDRLNSLGIIGLKPSFVKTESDSLDIDNFVVVNGLGKIFCSIIFN